LTPAERLRQDIAACRRAPPTRAEDDLALIADIGERADDTDWEALYGDESA
jgi:hypothetical protein